MVICCILLLSLVVMLVVPVAVALGISLEEDDLGLYFWISPHTLKLPVLLNGPDFLVLTPGPWKQSAKIAVLLCSSSYFCSQCWILEVGLLSSCCSFSAEKVHEASKPQHVERIKHCKLRKPQRPNQKWTKFTVPKAKEGHEKSHKKTNAPKASEATWVQQEPRSRGAKKPRSQDNYSKLTKLIKPGKLKKILFQNT